MIEQPVPETTLDRLVLEQARRTPDAPAVVQWDERLTYRDLISRAGALAAVLRARGVGPEVPVGVCAPRTPAMVVAALGVLMSGGCYVPLDPGHPETRRRDIAADAGAELIVGIGPGAIPIPERGGDGALETPSTAGPDHLAHVLYTSGSTGRPKGVLTTHRNIVDFVTCCAQFTGAGPETRSLGIASLGFDAATIDYWTPLTVGGCVQLLGERDRDDPTRLQHFIAEHRVNWGFITPSVLSLLDPDELPEWRLVLCGGEAVPASLARRWATPGRTVWNAYGPTETTVLAVVAELTGQDEQTVPLGRPLPRHTAHVVDGELLIGGPGLARGYLNRPGLTAARFVPDPFSTTPGARLYRTGDLARIRADGRIEYLGRDDGQIKVNGQRIEIGEIEAVLREQAGVEQVAVEALKGASGTELVAFVTPADAPEDLLAGAAERLTGVMMPGRVLRLAELPLNPSGKADRVRLRELASQYADEDGLSSEDERAIAEIWHRLLGRRPGPGTRFTAAGGDSISAMRLVAALRKEFGRDVAVEDVFAGRTPAGIAARVAKAEPLTGPAGLATGHPPTLSPPQRRLWFTDQLAPGEAPYNIPLAERIRGPLDTARLRAALRAVAERHEMLRWRVLENDGAPYAVCDPPADVPLLEVALDGAPDASGVVPPHTAESELHARLAADARTPFDLAAAPPWRATLYRLATDDHVLALTFHHIAFDGWSQHILYRDLALAYQGRPVPDRAASYADYAAWRERRDHLRADADVAWWLEHLRGAPTVVDLPRDRPRPAVATYRGAEASITLPDRADAAVRRLAAELGTTTAGVLLAGFGQVLRRLTGSPDAVIGAVVADRRLAEFDDQVGFFIDMLPVRLTVEDTAPFAEHVRRAAAELLEVAARPSAPVEVLVDKLGTARDTSRAPLVQIMFNVLNFAEPVLDLPGLQARTMTVEKPGSPLDMTVYVLERSGRLAVDLLYNPDLFDSERVTTLLADYAAVLGLFAEASQVPVAEIAAELPRDLPSPPDAMTVRTSGEPPGAMAAGAAADLESAVADVWGEVLGLEVPGREAIAPTDNFFDVGGTSLALTAVRARLTAQFGPRLKIVDLFRHPTIRSLAAFLERAADGPDTSAPELDQVHQRVAARRERAARRGRRLPGGPGTTPDRRGDQA